MPRAPPLYVAMSDHPPRGALARHRHRPPTRAAFFHPPGDTPGGSTLPKRHRPPCRRCFLSSLSLHRRSGQFRLRNATASTQFTTSTEERSSPTTVGNAVYEGSSATRMATSNLLRRSNAARCHPRLATTDPAAELPPPHTTGQHQTRERHHSGGRPRAGNRTRRAPGRVRDRESSAAHRIPAADIRKRLASG
jgi:hypothetical protein